MKDSQAQDIADACRMLSDTTRIGIIELLTKEPKAVGTLCKSLDLPQPTVSHHLALLRHSRILDRKRSGKQMIYSLNIKQFSSVKAFLAKVK